METFKNLLVRKGVKIMNGFNQAPNLTQDTTWENDKKQLEMGPWDMDASSIDKFV